MMCADPHHFLMKLFFILYWATFFIGWFSVRSYRNHYRHHVLRHVYAERHRSQLARRYAREHGRAQMNLF